MLTISMTVEGSTPNSLSMEINIDQGIGDKISSVSITCKEQGYEKDLINYTKKLKEDEFSRIRKLIELLKTTQLNVYPAGPMGLDGHTITLQIQRYEHRIELRWWCYPSEGQRMIQKIVNEIIDIVGAEDAYQRAIQGP